MATTKIIAIHHTLNKSLDYISDPNKTALNNGMDYVMNSNKTEQGLFVSSFNCGSDTAYGEMKHTQAAWGKRKAKVLGYHVMQSFKPGEVTPETAHQIGCELVNRCLAKKYEVVVTTHLNKSHLHNHIIFNSVSFADGTMYRNNFTDYYRDIRAVSDDLCAQHGLSVITEPGRKSKQYAEWKSEQDGKPTWRGMIRKDVDKAVKASISFQAFVRRLREQGYEVKTGVKHIAVRPPGKERFVRLRSLGERYTEEAIRHRILAQQRPERPRDSVTQEVKQGKYKGTFTLYKVTWKGLRALYFYYLYKLRRAQRELESVHYLIREDLRHLDQLTEQAKFLHRHGIDTEEQLETYRTVAEQKIDRFTDERRKLRNEKRRMGVSAERGAEIDTLIRVLSGLLKELRGDVRMCDAVLERAVVMRKKKVRIDEIQDEHSVENACIGFIDNREHML